ncbi:MAG: transaldolase family protein [Patescibacteria group bacterium]
MKPAHLKTKIFLDSGDPAETREALELLGFLDGQTTNPTLISKNPAVQAQIAAGKKYSKQEIFDLYRQVVTEISSLIPEGSVSIEVFADKTTTAQEMFTQGREMFSWIPNAHIKYPTTTEGLEAAEQSVKEGMRVNMTLVFSQEQGAAVYSATRGAQKGAVFLSPFIGRLDDLDQNGMDLIKNIIQMYKTGDGHVEVLTASIRTNDHLLGALQLGTDIVTAPLKTYKEWFENGMVIPENYVYNAEGLSPIEFKEVDLDKDWQEFNIQHELTEKGIEKFVSDWNNLIE